MQACLHRRRSTPLQLKIHFFPMPADLRLTPALQPECRIHLGSALLPWQVAEAPAALGAAVVLIVQVALKAFGDMEDSGKA